MAISYELKEAYKILEKKVLMSKDYQDFIFSLTENPEDFKKILNAFNINDEEKATNEDYKLISKSFENIEFMNSLAEVIGKSDEFNRVIRSAFKDEYGIEDVIYNHFIETKYGNVDKEDLTYVDFLFPILENTFGLDTIIKSIKDPNALNERFEEVSQDPSGLEAKDYIDAFNKLYSECKTVRDEEELRDLVNEAKGAFLPYINANQSIMIRKQINAKDSKEYAELGRTFDKMSESLLYVLNGHKRK